MRVLRTIGRAADRSRIDLSLDRVRVLIDETGARSYEPFLHVERAELAGLTHDDASRQRELREAHRLFAEMGANGHAERIAKEPGWQ